jgi:two-component system, LuxR family, response regulator FixJ
MKAGAVDVLEKPYSDGDLLKAIQSALKTRDAIPDKPDVVKAKQRIASLSQREREVLNALATGCPNKVIAFDLGISVRTVEVHRARMMKGLGVRQFAEAIRIAVLAGGLGADAHSCPASDDQAWSTRSSRSAYRLRALRGR